LLNDFLMAPRRLFADLPLRRKLMLITMVIVLAATLVIIVFLRQQSERSRSDNFVQHALAQTRLVAEYAASPLVFDDPKGASEILAKLALDPRVAYVLLSDAQGQPFAEIGASGADGSAAPPVLAPQGGSKIEGKLLHVAEPVKQKGLLGTLRVGWRLDVLEQEGNAERRFLLLVLAGVMVFSYLLTSWLQRIISGPLLALEAHARRMADTQDFSIRLKPPGRDEVGNLYRAFNFLIERVARREEDILAFNRSLEAKVAERTADLEEARDKADRASAGKSEFLANMSHEIRTPINAITGFTALARRTQLSPKQQNYLDKIHIAAQGLLRIINDLLDFSKIEAGHLDMEHIDFDLAEVMDAMLAHVGELAERQGLELLIKIAPDVPTHLVGDPLRLGQVLINLCGNAVKFTELGEVELRVEMEAPPPQAQANGEVALHFSVRDTGIGMTPEQAGKLFQAFAQADSSTTRRFGGTGLGLAISARLVDMMKGRIWLDTEAGRGTTFHFVVQLGLGSELPGEHDPALAAGLRGGSALIVDDNANARQILVAQLGALGIEAKSVASGEQALVELRRASSAGSPYPLVLMDWKMPGLDGLAATRAIRADPAIAGTPVVIMVTAYGREQAVGANENSELLDGILLKPVTPQLLAATLTRAMGAAPDEAPGAPDGRTALSRDGLPGVRLLLVDDNPVNQSLAQELLEQEGASVTVAGNGRVALEALEREGYAHYDIVLMDLQMPEMDGYEATRRIRAHPEGGKLPVIAMTAHAMVEERERCLALGMNDHLPKPIDPDLMVRKLRHWVGEHGLALAAQRPRQQRPAQRDTQQVELPAYLPGLDLTAGLWRCNGDARLLRDLLIQFSGNYGQSAACIAQHLREQRMDEARFLAHTVKGAAANLGAYALATAASDLNAALERDDAPVLAGLLANFEAAHATLMAGIAQIEQERHPHPADAPPADVALSAQARALLLELLERLEHNDTRAEALAEQLSAHVGTPPPAWFTSALRAIGALDYPGAGATLRTALDAS
jgi:two-component system, sensor histidine kinase and response regulator